MSKSMTDPEGIPSQGSHRPSRALRLRRRRRKPVSTKPATALVGQIVVGADGRPAPPRVPNPIVPPRTVARRTLLTLVAIMSFLACLAVASVSVVADRAQSWQRQIAEEVTIQIKPVEGADMEEAVARAVDIATQVAGVNAATPLDVEQSNALLEPWLGSDFDASELPIPRLIAVQVTDDADLRALAQRLSEEIPSASLDDHGQWLQRLSAMARVMTLL